MNGWIKLHRQLQDNDFWLVEKFTRGQAWVDLLLSAQATPGAIRRRGILVKLPIGSVGVSQEELAKRWKWSRGKVIRFLNELEVDLMISRKMEQKKTSVSSYIFIENYSSYQKTEQKTDRRRTEDGQKTVPEQEGKEGEKEKKRTNKRKFGEFKNVFLTEKEYTKLKEKFNGKAEEKINTLSEYMARVGKKYKSHYLTILKWARDEQPKDSKWI